MLRKMREDVEQQKLMVVKRTDEITKEHVRAVKQAADALRAGIEAQGKVKQAQSASAQLKIALEGLQQLPKSDAIRQEVKALLKQNKPIPEVVEYVLESVAKANGSNNSPAWKQAKQIIGLKK